MTQKMQKKSMLTLLAAASLALPLSTGPAMAQPAGSGAVGAGSSMTQSSAQSSAECSAKAQTAAAQGQGDTYDMTLLEGTAAADAAASAEALLDSGQVTVHASDGVQREGVKVYSVDTGSGVFTSVTYPVAGDYNQQLSNFTVLFDADGGLVQHTESLLSRAESGNFQVTSYADGALTNDQDTGLPYLDDAEVRAQMSAPAADSAGATVAAEKNTAACLAAVLGVSVTVAGVIAFVCAGSCSVPITPVTGPVCAACIGGFAVVGGASIAGVASCF